MARVAIDARISRSWSSGIGVYTLRMLEALAAQEAPHRYVLITAPGAGVRSLPASVDQVELPYAVGGVDQHLRLGGDLRALNVDVLLSTHPASAPLLSRCPRLVMVHDLIPLTRPRYYSPAKRLYYRTIVRWSLRTASRVLVDSRSTRDDCERLLGVSSSRMRVIYGGVAERFFRDGHRSRPAAGRPYILYVGNKRPHKNLDRLLEAFALMNDAGDRPCDLVIAGREEAGDVETDGRRLRELADRLGLNGGVRFAGEVAAEELPALYAGAEAFAYLSSYEGFGLPPLEAMASGTPVVALDTSSLPEVVGDGGLLLETADPALVARHLRALLDDRCLRERLSERARRRARTFTWQKVACAVAEEIDCALGVGLSA